ncbi:unnamed protein product [Lepidochelys kempii]
MLELHLVHAGGSWMVQMTLAFSGPSSHEVILLSLSSRSEALAVGGTLPVDALLPSPGARSSSQLGREPLAWGLWMAASPPQPSLAEGSLGQRFSPQCTCNEG